MSNIMKGLGLAHTLAEALSNSKADFGLGRVWTDTYIDALTTKEGKSRVLGPMLDVLRGDAEIIPKKRIIFTDSVKPGDNDVYSDDAVVVFNRSRSGKTKSPRSLVLGDFTLGVASKSMTSFYERYKDEIESGSMEPKPNTHIDVPNHLLGFNRRSFLPNFLIGKKLPGIALRNFYSMNPHHIPKCFSKVTLFWGTICKNSYCYYVPGIKSDGTLSGLIICSYKTVGDKDVLGSFDMLPFDQYDAAIFI